MRSPDDLSQAERVSIARLVQQALYLDRDAQNQPIWNPDKSWEGADVCDNLTALLADFGLVPHDIISVLPCQDFRDAQQ
jgi:hypothetical protein